MNTDKKPKHKSKRKKYKKKSKRKKYKVNSKKCKKYSKTKSPRCDDQDKCIWIIGSGCKFNKHITKKNIKKTDFIEHKKEMFKDKKKRIKEIKINKEIKQILMKNLPKQIKIKDEIEREIKSNNTIIVKNYNIPIGKKLIKLDRHRKKVLFNKKVLEYFWKLVIHNEFEIGGKLDFNLDNLFERSTSFLGSVNSVILNVYDYEVPYHTHPLIILKNKGIIFNTPSVGDYEKETFLGDLGVSLWYTIRTNKYLQQCNVVFSPDGVYVWYYSQKMYNTFKKYKNNYKKFKDLYFAKYKHIIGYDQHYGRLLSPVLNNHWMKDLEKIGIFMFKYIDKKYTHGLNWNKYWDINDNNTLNSIKNIKSELIPKILKGTYVYPSNVPLYIVPIEPLERLN